MKRVNLLIGTLLLVSCSPDNPATSPSEKNPEDSQTETEGLLCSHKRVNAEMVRIDDPTWGTFCIDRYEAHYISGKLGDTIQNNDPTSVVGNGSTTAKVGSLAGKEPLVNVSWYQAQAACANSGAHLCTKEEWEAACRGVKNLTYPYGDTFAKQQCNDSFYRADHDDLSGNFNPLQPTGSLAGCVTESQIFDLSGNVEEWLATAIPAMADSTVLDHRVVRGGSYRSNTEALQCTDIDAHRDPNMAAADLGFRCCLKIEDK